MSKTKTLIKTEIKGMVARGEGEREMGGKGEGEYSQQYCGKFHGNR